MCDHVKSFKVKLGLWIKQLNEGNLVHFLTLKSTRKVESKCSKEYVDLLSNLHHQFEVRFSDFERLQPQFQLFSTPFAVKIDSVAEELQMELAELQYDTILKQKYADEGISKFYSFLFEKGFRIILC